MLVLAHTSVTVCTVPNPKMYLLLIVLNYMTRMPSQSMADQWQERNWLNIAVVNGEVSCLICTTHKTKLQCVRNCSDAFVKGIVGSAIKVNIVKHESSDQHALELHVHAIITVVTC